MSEEVHVAGFDIQRELGKGGMATVYLAVQENFRREVALKVMAPALVADPSFAERFLREARIVANLAHPNIVAVYDVGVSGDNYFLAMEFHKGGDLASKIAGGISHSRAIDIVRQIAGALAYAHSNGFVHRDIKPGNVLFSKHGHVVLTDFGIAKAADTSTDLTQVKRVVGEREMTKEGSIVGTPSYMSPEQARGRAVDGRADIYSLGILLYEMLTGNVPYHSTDPFAVAIMHINEPTPQLPPEHAVFQPLLDKLLAKEPEDRFQTGGELIEALKELARVVEAPKPTPEELRTVIVPRSEIPESARKPGQGRNLQIAVGAGALVVVAALVGWLLVEPAAPPGSQAGSTQGETAQATGDASSPAADDSAQTPDVPLAAGGSSARVQQLLRDADLAIQQNRLSSPPGDNALEMYQQVFDLDPGNREAREGQVRVADRYLELAKDAVRERRVRSARRYVDKVQQFAPGHPELAAAQQLVANAEREGAGGQRNELRIMGLLGQARIAFNDDKLTTPEGSSAWDKYRAVLKLEPNHPEALDGIQRVASSYLQLAQGEIAKGNYEKADEYLAKAAMVSPTHPGLPAARSEVQHARAGS
jgi:serine/threonine-protein kinase PpkA